MTDETGERMGRYEYVRALLRAAALLLQALCGTYADVPVQGSVPVQFSPVVRVAVLVAVLVASKASKAEDGGKQASKQKITAAARTAVIGKGEKNWREQGWYRL